MKRSLWRFLYAVVLGIIGAGIVHIAIILLVPSYASASLWDRLEKLGSQQEFHSLSGADWIIRSDPLIRTSACRFNLNNGPVHISAIGKVPFWSLALYNRDGDITFSLNDQVSAETDLLIVSPLQKILLEQETPPSLVQTVVITQPQSEGVAVVRVFEPDTTWRDEITEFLKSAECMNISN